MVESYETGGAPDSLSTITSSALTIPWFGG